MIKTIVIGSVALLTAAAYAALSETSAAPQAAPAAPFAAALCCSPSVTTEPAVGAQAIREAHSDGGYYWYRPTGSQ